MTMSVAMVGLGEIAQKAYLPALSAWKEIELLLCSRNPASVADIQTQYRPARYHQPGCAYRLAPSGCLCSDISTTDREIIERLLLAGVDVFAEEPLTLTPDETRYLAELADRQGRVLMVGFNRRFAPFHRQARQLWGERPIQMAVLQKNRSSAYHPSLYQNYIDDTIHIIDLLRFFCGDGTPTYTSYQMGNEKLIGAASTVVYDHGGYGLVLTSLQAGRWYEQYALHGGNTSLYVDAFNRLTLATEKVQKVWEEKYPQPG